MDSLSDTIWDVVICGTGIHQALLALSLSRSGKKVLHLDRNKYYGGSEAAFSLEDASSWVHDSHNSSHAGSRVQAISITSEPKSPKLGPSRSYTLTLSPYLIYSQSRLLAALVSSRLHTQLEFQPFGPWWLYKDGLSVSEEIDHQRNGGSGTHAEQVGNIPRINGVLQRIPSTREDVFANDTLSLRDKRALMKFLRSVLAEPSFEAELPEDVPLSSTLAAQFAVVTSLHPPLLALSLPYHPAESVKTRSAVPRIRRHMRSIGTFGPGFGAVTTKYGGGAEIAQAACRASAVGGATYVLGRALKRIDGSNQESAEAKALPKGSLRLELSDGEEVEAHFVAGCTEDIPTDMINGPPAELNSDIVEIVHSINIVSSPLEHLFPPTSEGGPMPAGAMVVFGNDSYLPSSPDAMAAGRGPINMVIHSSDSGECPRGQSVIYASTLSSQGGHDGEALRRLASAVTCLLDASPSKYSKPELLWSLQYRATGRPVSSEPGEIGFGLFDRVMSFPSPSIDLAFDDSILENVKEVWKRVMGDAVVESAFLTFDESRVRGEDDM